MQYNTEYETVIETEALEREWEILDPPEDEAFDKDKVNVEFSVTVQGGGCPRAVVIYS